LKRLIVDGKTVLYGIIGNPVSHSFSPAMQTSAFQHLGINAVYLPFPTTESNLPHALDALYLLNIRGFNVTVPFKEKIVKHLPLLSDEVKLLGSVNTVVRTDNGWKGYSTDGSGFIRSLKEKKVELAGKSILLAGAGGAARAIALSLANQELASLSILNRTHEKARLLNELLESSGTKTPIKINPINTESFDIIINTTSVGMEGNQCLFTKEQINSSKLVVDIIYNPPETPLLVEARRMGIPGYNGIGMLLFQGIEAFEIWTGEKAPIQVMEESLNNSLAII
jgi:shikimate dehydrogenase